MHVFQLDQPYPLHDKATGVERVLLQRTEEFFDVLYYSLAAEEDATVWSRGALRFGLSEPTPGVPLVLFELPGGWQFDVSLNLRHNITAPQAQAWLHSPATVVTLYLIDAQSNVLRAQRLLSVPAGWAAELRAAAGRQRNRFTDGAAVARAIVGAESVSLALQISTTAMLKAGEG